MFGDLRLAAEWCAAVHLDGIDGTGPLGLQCLLGGTVGEPVATDAGCGLLGHWWKFEQEGPAPQRWLFPHCFWAGSEIGDQLFGLRSPLRLVPCRTSCRDWKGELAWARTLWEGPLAILEDLGSHVAGWLMA